jgi:hypothetical protein
VKRRIVALVLLVSLGLFAAGCGNGTVASWFADKAQPAPVTIDILCDASTGSSCNDDSLAETLHLALGTAAAHPGSTVRLWMQGRTIETTRVVGCGVSPTKRVTSRHARAEAEERWISKEMTFLTADGHAAMQGRIRRSPIAESLGVIALAPVAPHQKHYVVAITDALEVSDFGEFECGRLPRPERFARVLAEHRVLAAHALAQADVKFCHVDLRPIDSERCRASLDRAAEVRDIWTRTLRAAGAASVEIRQGALDAIDSTEKEANPDV